MVGLLFRIKHVMFQRSNRCLASGLARAVRHMSVAVRVAVSVFKDVFTCLRCPATCTYGHSQTHEEWPERTLNPQVRG